MTRGWEGGGQGQCKDAKTSSLCNKSSERLSYRINLFFRETFLLRKMDCFVILGGFADVLSHIIYDIRHILKKK